MVHPLTINLDVRNQALGKLLSEEFLNQPDISIAGRASASAAGPGIFFLDDDAGEGNILGKIRSLRRECPNCSIFVISSDSSPDHIVEVMKAGASEYFLTPINPQKIREAVGRVQLQLKESGPAVKGKIFSFIGSKGGLGATVLAVNTAAALAGGKSGKSALLDLSLQTGDSSVLLDILPKATMADLASNFHRLDAGFLSGAMERHPSGVELLAAPSSPEESAGITADQIGRVLHLGRSLYETLVLDCPSMALDDRTAEAVRASDMVLIVIDLSVPSVRNASRLIKAVQRSGVPQRIEVVANRFVKSKSSTIEEVEKSLGRRIFWLFPNDYENTMASINRGTPLMKYDPRSPLARSVAEFARKLLDPAAFPNYRGVKGLLGKAV